MLIHFYKYQGTGNDFIMVDDRDKSLLNLNTDQISHLCDRRFGIGADGLILLRDHTDYDFEMVYYNSDGRQSSMCGNGGRCILRFANDLGIQRDEYDFLAIDGPHKGIVEGDTVRLQMKNVGQIEDLPQGQFFLDTGSPHHIVFSDSLPEEDFLPKAKAIRHSDKYDEEGVNVNYVSVTNDGLEMRTFERGVEDETFSCGTGVTAAVVAAHHKGLVKDNQIEVQTAGGRLNLSFSKTEDSYSDIWLSGPATYVFEGEVEIAQQ